jgi:hypothetical protein
VRVAFIRTLGGIDCSVAVFRRFRCWAGAIGASGSRLDQCRARKRAATQGEISLPARSRRAGNRSRHQPRQIRKRFLKELEALFVEILLVAEARGLVKRSNVSLDGTKIKANASQHKAVQVDADDRPGLERLLRYCARPIFARERLAWGDPGPQQVGFYRLPKPIPDGRSQLS